jgi:transcriptional regulator with XRE-family HTH domain
MKAARHRAPVEPSSPKAMLQVLGRRIRSLREGRGFTQEEFASRCGISISFASLLERGERSPSYETLVHLASALETPLEELFKTAPIAGSDDPYHAKLLEFARRKKLTRAQVDRLIAVGQVVFDGRLEPLAKGSLKPTGTAEQCTVEDCGRMALAKGLCASHYHRARRAKQ